MQSLLTDTPTPQMSCLEAAVDLPLDKPGAPTVPNRPVRVSLGYVFPGMDTEAARYLLDPASVDARTAVRILALHEEGGRDLDVLATDLSQRLMHHGYDYRQTETGTWRVSWCPLTSVVAMRSRRKSMDSLAAKVRKYGALTDDDVERMTANGWQPLFERDNHDGERVYPVADGSGLLLIAPTVGAMYNEILPVLHEVMDVRAVKDYVLAPKRLTGYQAVHAIGSHRDSPFLVEVQIRTPEMDVAARRGMAGVYHCDKRIYCTPAPPVERRQRIRAA